MLDQVDPQYEQAGFSAHVLTLSKIWFDKATVELIARSAPLLSASQAKFD